MAAKPCRPAGLFFVGLWAAGSTKVCEWPALRLAMEQTPESELSKSARRAVETTLQLLDEGLCRVEQWAEGRQRSSVLYTETNRLSPAQRNALLREVAAMRLARACALT